MAGTQDVVDVDLDKLVQATWRQNTPEYARADALIKDFEAAGVLDYVSFDAAGDAIRKHLKSYIETMSRERFTLSDVLTPHKWLVSTISHEMERALIASRMILDIEPDPEEGISAPYTEDTWQRAVKLLREMADLFWQATGDFLVVPSIGPAMEGSIDLFWEVGDLTLLINVPADPSKGATFFGRRLESSKISGVLDRHDVQPRHLTGWLSGRD